MAGTINLNLDTSALQASLQTTITEAAAAEGALGADALAALSALGAQLLPLATAEAQQQLSGNSNSAGYLKGLAAVVESKAAELALTGIVVNKALLQSDVARWTAVLASVLPAVINGVIPGSGVVVSAAIAAAEAALNPAA